MSKVSLHTIKFVFRSIIVLFFFGIGSLFEIYLFFTLDDMIWESIFFIIAS